MWSRSICLASIMSASIACAAGHAGGLGSGAGGNQGTGTDPNVTITLDPTGGGTGGGDPKCKTTLDVVYRDFNVGPDFERSFAGDVVRRQLLQPTLDADSKPQFLDSIGCPWDEKSPLACANWTVSQPVITSKETFDQWYRDVDTVNMHFQKELVLSETAPGSGLFAYDSTAFFPLLPTEGFGITPPSYMNQNFLFTTEIHLRFGYVAGQKFTFIGDDDMWVFVNNRLALDLGSTHSAATGVIDFDAEAADLGISPGNAYSMDIFHAERHTTKSNFHIETNISCFTSIIVPK